MRRGVKDKNSVYDHVNIQPFTATEWVKLSSSDLSRKVYRPKKSLFSNEDLFQFPIVPHFILLIFPRISLTPSFLVITTGYNWSSSIAVLSILPSAILPTLAFVYPTNISLQCNLPRPSAIKRCRSSYHLTNSRLVQDIVANDWWQTPPLRERKCLGM